MPSGGARPNSGPPPNPYSGNSDRRGLAFTKLAQSGYQGKAPSFPLPRLILFKDVLDEDGLSVRVVNEEATKSFHSRELKIWRESWSTPQALAWIGESWRWPALGEYCRLKTVVERSPGSSAALVGQLHRYREQLGLTPDGLSRNGWVIVADEVSEKRRTAEGSGGEQRRPSSRDRFEVIGNG